MASIHTFEDRFARSVSTFTTKVWPLVKEKFGPGELIAAEDLEGGPLARMVDIRCGIDYLFCPDDGDPFGIAQRCCNGSWDSFTMSVATYDRLVKAWERPHGRIVPSVIIQAYTVNDRVRSVGMIRTGDLIGQPSVEKTSSTSGAFFSWGFHDLLVAGVAVDLFPAPVLRDPFE
jgi:hypothetical protein